MCSAISLREVWTVVDTHGPQGLLDVIEALRAFKVNVSSELERSARNDWESALAVTRLRTLQFFQGFYHWYALLCTLGAGR